MNWYIVLQYVLPSALGVAARLFSPWPTGELKRGNSDFIVVAN
jgi:hypothetical protein